MINNNNNQVEFTINDIESLKNAKIDDYLLENYFFESNKNKNLIKNKILTKHSLLYGYYIIPKD